MQTHPFVMSAPDINKLMPLSDTYFQLFELPESFDIDTQTLAERFRELQRSVHPDKFANSSDQERRLAMQHATHINEAYQTLKHPLQRGQYLLSLQGIETNEQQAQVMDPTFLFEQMELREKLEAVNRQNDPFNALNELMDTIEQRLKRFIKELAQQFSKQDYTQAQDTLRKLQFFYKLHQEALNLEEQLS